MIHWITLGNRYSHFYKRCLVIWNERINNSSHWTKYSTFTLNDIFTSNVNSEIWQTMICDWIWVNILDGWKLEELIREKRTIRVSRTVRPLYLCKYQTWQDLYTNTTIALRPVDKGGGLPAVGSRGLLISRLVRKSS